MSHPNLVSLATQVLVRHSQGTFLGFLGLDDRSLSEFLMLSMLVTATFLVLEVLQRVAQGPKKSEVKWLDHSPIY